MNSSFRNWFWPLLCFCSMLVRGQKEKPVFDDDILGEIGVSYVLPQAWGDNFVSKGYDLKNGLNVEGLVLITKKWQVGAQYGYFKGNVTNIDAVGAILSSRITHIHAVGGYSILGTTKFGIRTGLGIGYAKYNHKQSTTKLMDDGFSIATNVSFSYRLGNSMGIYAKLDHYWDFLSIDTAPELTDYFRRTQIFALSIGIKFYVF
ncbi:hypothetical protein DX873_11005 [Flagellimonas nanhaiensis]|uniref:Outer membrane protein beta-barrel domain-containing protein n=2 Tax=Flagellimonas nanhaiensis TaxID=2292706 RepID=A0A371JQT9_9FLAO|nr:hypothetical protein DX873_11005 [Allomuricauda nanhaiensis]